MKRSILVINGGSSSIKFSVYECGDCLRQILSGKLTDIGSNKASLTFSTIESNEAITRPTAAKNYAEALPLLIELIQQFFQNQTLVGVGHRIVHGGNRYFDPVQITAEVLAELRRISPLDPDHLPDEILLAESIGALFPQTPQIACFDTAFHRDIPVVAQLLPIPRRYFEAGLRRYGFHGLSCQYLMNTLGELAGAEVARGKIILAHLGSGASITAVVDGKSIDTSMGLTPCSGLPMSSRSGDIDPGLVFQLAQSENMDARQFHCIVNHEAGLKGISCTTGNISNLLMLEKQDSRAADAVNYFCYQTSKWICSLAGAMGGVDTLIFSGGIGENLAEIRARVSAKLVFIGVVLDVEKNKNNSLVISAPGSPVRVRVIKTDEEIIIANHVATFLDQ